MTSQPPIQPLLPPNTIVPTNDDLFVPYLNRLYEDIASAVNSKDPNFYPMAITDVAKNILNVPNFGAFIICVSGVETSLPTITASLCKASASGSGSVTGIGAQVGTGAWAGNQLIISSTATNFQIRHNRAGATGNFNIRIIGTQGF
jgi:hypothetical protein